MPFMCYKLLRVSVRNSLQILTRPLRTESSFKEKVTKYLALVKNLSLR